MVISNGILFNIDKRNIVDGKLIIPDGVTEIASDAISCKNFDFVSFPKTLKKIQSQAFFNCKNLMDVNIPDSVETIEYQAFCGCKSLDKVILPASLKTLEQEAFSNCDLDEIVIPKGIENLGFTDVYPDFRFLDKRPEGIAFTKTKNENSIPINLEPISTTFFATDYKNFSKNISDLKNDSIFAVYNYFSFAPDNELIDFIKHHNFTFYKNLQKKYPCLSGGFIHLYYNLGGFSTPFEKNGKMVDYAQRVGEFLMQKLEKNEVSFSLLSQIGEDMSSHTFSPEFTDFFIDKFDELLKIEAKNYNFIANCYNHFDEVQATNTNNHGSQRQLKPTVEKFYNYFNRDKFKNITENNKNIATTIAPFFDNQETFDDAVKINEERVKNKTPNNILNFHLTEKSAFEKIDNYASQIKILQSQILSKMGLTADNEFSFDWLEKNDPQNFILGKYCSCCAHLEGAGYGIMKASITHPRVQNLVIKDKFNKIVAKSTIYVNVKYGYGVFNNVEVNDGLLEKDKELIYQSYIKAVDAFATEYNKEHPDNDLKMITVGMHANDLMQYFTKYNKRKLKLLPAINYGQFCPGGVGYVGDSNLVQYVVWKNPNLKSIKKQNELNAEPEK